MNRLNSFGEMSFGQHFPLASTTSKGLYGVLQMPKASCGACREGTAGLGRILHYSERGEALSSQQSWATGGMYCKLVYSFHKNREVQNMLRNMQEKSCSHPLPTNPNNLKESQLRPMGRQIDNFGENVGCSKGDILLKGQNRCKSVSSPYAATDSYIYEVCCNSSLGGFWIANVQLKQQCEKPLVLIEGLFWHMTRSLDEEKLQYSPYVPVPMFALCSHRMTVYVPYPMILLVNPQGTVG